VTTAFIDPVLGLIFVMGAVALAPAGFALTRHWGLLSAPVVVGGFFAYFYVLLPSAGLFFREGQYLFDERTYLFGLVVAILSLLTFYAGWVLRTPQEGIRGRAVGRGYSPNSLYIYGAGFSILGVVGYATTVYLQGGWAHLHSQPHYMATRDVYMTAYIYDLALLVFPGILLMLQSVLLAKKVSWFRGKALFVVALSALVSVEAVLMSSRQISFFILAIWIFLLPLMRSRPPARVALLAGLLLAGLIPFLLLVYRSHLHLGMEASEFADVESRDVVERVLRPSTGNEFITHSSLVTACFDSGEYDYGLQVINVLVNFVPRVLWREKPYDLFRVRPDDLIYNHGGWIPANGYVLTGAGSVFFEWGFLGLVFWFLLGRWSRGLFEKTKQGSPKSAVIYVGLICVLFVFVAQDLWAGLKNAIFMFGPLCLSYGLSSYTIRSTLDKNIAA